ncbi:MAG: amidohydrolase family protein [Alphaproteobacteria bacterium]|nr:amidohydrolase family protein [Alphaproteobacteria bacterium]
MNEKRPLLLHNARLVVPGQATRAELPAGAVLIDGDRIAAVLTDRAEIAAATAAERIDLAGRIVMPGLINAHHHAYGNVLRGTENALPLEQWALYTVAYGRSLTPAALRLAVLIGAAEMMRAGVTTVLDHFPYVRVAEAMLGAYEESGMRAGFAPFIHDRFDHDILGVALPEDVRRAWEGAGPLPSDEVEQRIRALVGAWQGRAGRIRILLGPNAPQRCSPELLALWRRLAVELDLHVHTHLLETLPQARHGRSTAPGGTVGEMDRLGLLNERLSVAHAVWTLDSERELLARRGVTVVHNPTSNFMLGSGVMPLADYRRHGIAVALGTDSANSGGRLNMFDVMRTALMLPRPVLPSRDWPEAGAIFDMATSGGARALGLAAETGQIARGMKADLVVVDGGGATMVALAPNLVGLVQHAGPEAVSAVMVDGRWVYRDGRVLAFDEAAVLAEFKSITAEITRAAQADVALATRTVPMFERLYERNDS